MNAILRGMLTPGLALVIVAVTGFQSAHGQEADADSAVPTPVDEPLGEPIGTLETGGALVDRDFGVSTRSAGLDRQVEMYQWRMSEEGEYGRTWNTARIDSSGFDEEHQNPPFSLESPRWWSQDATLDGQPVDAEVLRMLGEWQVFRPGFTRLPLNMAAAFQPEGDGLSSAENPLRPQIGDLRIRWRERVLPPLQGQVVFRDGAWRLRPGARNPGNGNAGPSDDESSEKGAGRKWSAWWLSMPVALVLLLLVLRWRKTRAVS